MYLTPQPATGGFRMGSSRRTVPPYWNRLRYPSPSYLGKMGICCGLGSLDAITPDAAAKQVFPNAPRSPNAGHNMATYNLLLASAQAGQIVKADGSPIYIPGGPDCSATGVSSNLKLAQTASGLALTGASIGLVAAGTVTAAALAPFTMGISALIGLFPLIFGHHAKAVKQEQSVLCAAVPAANNYLQIIDQSVTAGQFTPQQGIDALNSLLSDFNSQVNSIRHGADPTVSGECNAACVISSALKAIVLAKTSQYQDLMTAAAASPASAVTDAVSQAAASAGIPSWALYAAAGFLLWKLI